MGSWKRTITSPFRKACTILTLPQQQHHAAGDGGSGGESKRGKPRRRDQLEGSAAAPQCGGGGGDAGLPATAQLYGDVMACAYEDVQVMWSLLDGKAKVLDAAS